MGYVMHSIKYDRHSNTASMKRFALIATILLLFASVAYAADDSNTIYPLDALNPTSGTFGSAAYPGELFNALSSEDAGRQYEQGIGNCVSVEASAQSCLAGTSAGLTMTPGSCIAYNQMWRSTETGSITFPNSSTCWLALDERVKVAAPIAGMTDLRNHVVDGSIEGHCDCMFFLNTYRWDFPQVAALIAPRPLLIGNSD